KEREPEMVSSDLNKVVGEVVELMEGRGRDRNVELRYEPASFMPKLLFDPEGLHRAVLNVVSNAIVASDPRHRPEPELPPDADPNTPVPEPGPGLVQVR